MARKPWRQRLQRSGLMIVLAMLGIVAAIPYRTSPTRCAKGRRSGACRRWPSCSRARNASRSSNATYSDSTNFAPGA